MGHRLMCGWQASTTRNVYLNNTHTQILIFSVRFRIKAISAKNLSAAQFSDFLGQWQACIPLKLIFDFWKGSKKRFFKRNFRRFLSFWAGSSLTKKRQKEWSNRFFSFLWPPQMCLFWFQNSFRILKKSKKNPKKTPFTPKIGKIQKTSF